MKISICAVILSLFVGCNVNHKTDIKLVKGTAVIAGKVQNFKNNSIVIRCAAPAVTQDIRQSIVLDSLGNFKTVIELYHAQDVDLNYEKGHATLYIEPGDSLNLYIDAQSFKKQAYPYYKISGLNSSTSKNIRDFFHFHNPFSYVPQNNKSTKELLTELRKQMHIEDSVLNEFSMKEKSTVKFMNWAKDNIKYTFAGYAFAYFAYNDMKYKEHKLDIFSTSLFPIDRDSAIVSSMYNLYLSNYSVAKYLISDSIFNQLNKKKDFKDAYNRYFDNITKNEKPGLSRDIMIYKIFNTIFTNISNFSFDDKSMLWKKYKGYINNQELSDIINVKISAYAKKDNEKENTFISNLSPKSASIGKFLETLHSRYKDKIIYIDIWAVDCFPCRYEFSYAIDLHNRFKNKPVAFVNLCFDSNKKDWEKTIVKENIKGYNYFIGKDKSELYRSELGFLGYPTYMIINKKGKLINKNAPRPSSGDEINNLLSKLI